tara:strand:+ start:21048 stop:21233 length:186 start_codon:yes stop_codon:yes gene_type:complete
VDRKEMRDFMNYVNDSNSGKLYEVLTNVVNLNLDKKQMKFILELMETNTKECFFRVMEKMK